jgi:hypothetical protein
MGHGQDSDVEHLEFPLPHIAFLLNPLHLALKVLGFHVYLSQSTSRLEQISSDWRAGRRRTSLQFP